MPICTCLPRNKDFWVLRIFLIHLILVNNGQIVLHSRKSETKEAVDLAGRSEQSLPCPTESASIQRVNNMFMSHQKIFCPAAILVDLAATGDFQELLGPTGQGKVLFQEVNLAQKLVVSHTRSSPASTMSMGPGCPVLKVALLQNVTEDVTTLTTLYPIRRIKVLDARATQFKEMLSRSKWN